MKKIYSFLTISFLFTALNSVLGQGSYIFSATDIYGDAHNTQNYLDAGKPILIFDFTAYSGQLWLSHEAGASIDLYNSIGQGGTNEIVVIYIAGFGFDSIGDIYAFDFSNELGPGYESVDMTENNPIPIILAADNAEVSSYAKGSKNWLCPQNEEVWMNYEPLEAEAMLNHLYDQCCTAVEPEDVSLSWSSFTIFEPNCNPSSVEYVLANEAGIDQNTFEVDVFLNGIFIETVMYNSVLEGCTSVTLEYNNPVIQAGDQITMAVGQPDSNSANDTITIVQEIVDTVGTKLKIEITEPTNAQSFLYYNANGAGSGVIENSNNWFSYLFLEPGCHELQIGGSEDPDVTDMVLVGSVDANDVYTDTLFYGEMNADGIGMNFTIYADGPAAPQQAWGYVFEDENETGEFSPEYPRIEGVQVNYGTMSTFTDSEGYYEFPASIPFENISISYNQNVWPVYTTPNAGYVGNEIYAHNFGLNANDPVWNLTSNFDFGMPYQCESGIYQHITVWNSGNQPTAGELVFEYDPLLTPIGYNPAPLSIGVNEVTFSIPEIQYGGVANFSIEYEDISAALLGQLVSAAYTITSFDDTGNAVNVNSESITDTLYCAYDPNDKYGFPLGEGQAGFIASGTPLKYRIRFQNTGNLPANTVVIRDTLSEALNWESFQPAGASHAHNIVMDAETREIVWTFNDIMLPDSASDPMGSIGTLWFDIEMQDLEPGDVIENTAFIYFDQNEAILTNTSLHTISDPVSADIQKNIPFLVYPNPAGEQIFIKGAGIENGTVRITDISGRLIMEQSLNRQSIDVSKLHSGLYLLTFGADSSQVVKLVIEH